MIYSAALVGLAALIALLVFFWRRSGLGSGRAFGNRIAALLTHGVAGSPRDLLVSLAKSKPGLDEASVELGPLLAKGIARMEARFGKQEMVDQAKPVVARLVSEYERTR